jgi:hypothetical protein
MSSLVPLLSGFLVSSFPDKHIAETLRGDIKDILPNGMTIEDSAL